MHTRIGLVTILIVALAGCGQTADPGAGGSGAASADPAADIASANPAADIVPAIVPPGEAADPSEPPSYEVAIASAAAYRNRALERCAAQPAAVRTQCEQEANAAFADSQAKLQDLRGNTE